MNEPTTDEWRRWATDRRYYCAVVQRDIFGAWELLKVWGGLGSHLGGHQVCPSESREQAIALLEAEGRRRSRRGYRELPSRTALG